MLYQGTCLGKKSGVTGLGETVEHMLFSKVQGNMLDLLRTEADMLYLGGPL